jgi:hypothetical protein
VGGSEQRCRIAHARAGLAAILLALALLAIAIIGRQVIAAHRAAGSTDARGASGELHRVIEPSGPSDIERLGQDVESMR